MSKMTVLIIRTDDVTAATLQEISDTIGVHLQSECEPTQEATAEDLPTDVSPVIPLRDVEIFEIRKALTRHGGNREATAKALGIGERTLYRKIRSYGLDGKK